MASFSTLSLRPELLSVLNDLNFSEMTPVQQESIPLILQGCDVIAQAKTGSGKTAAFGLGLLQQLKVEAFRVQVLVLCPTRELGDQVAKELRRLARGIHNIKILTLLGGMPFHPQTESLRHSAHIIVGTPGRVEEHLRKKSLNLNALTMFVLDEADRMLDMGFQPTIDAITLQLPRKRQNLLFSATFPDEIERLSMRVLNDPQRVTIDVDHVDNNIAELLFEIPGEDARTDAVARLLFEHQPESALVFCNTKQETEEVAGYLNNVGFASLAIHGDLEQRDRTSRLVQFSNRSITVLVATDVAARGLDIESLPLVINHRIAHETEVHTHRVGRTGRAGESGAACTLFTRKESFKVKRLEEQLGSEFIRSKLPATSEGPAPTPPFVTLELDAGKKRKIRPGDVLGALTGEKGISGSDVGKISVNERATFIAVRTGVERHALNMLNNGKVKGRSFRARKLR